MAARTLYWVNNGGNVYDGEHLSLSSGGSPGEAAPTYEDTVIWDENSFDEDGQVVECYDSASLGYAMYCKNMSWEGVTNNPTFGDNADYQYYINLLGGGYCNFSPDMSFNGIICVIFYGYSEAEYPPPYVSYSLKSAGLYIHNVWAGAWPYTYGVPVSVSLSDALDTGYLLINPWCYFDSSGMAITAWDNGTGLSYTPGYLSFSSLYNLDLGSSEIICEGFVLTYEYAETSEENPRTYLITEPPILYAKQVMSIDVTNPLSPTVSFDELILGSNTATPEAIGNCLLYGPIPCNELTMYRNNQYLVGGGGATLTFDMFMQDAGVDNLIYIASTDSGITHFVKTTGAVSVDYWSISMSHAEGGAAFYAGSHSIDYENNEGWIFEDDDPFPIDYAATIPSVARDTTVVALTEYPDGSIGGGGEPESKIYLGSVNVPKIYLGSTPITSVYFGTELIYSNTGGGGGPGAEYAAAIIPSELVEILNVALTIYTHADLDAIVPSVSRSTGVATTWVYNRDRAAIVPSESVVTTNIALTTYTVTNAAIVPSESVVTTNIALTTYTVTNAATIPSKART